MPEHEELGVLETIRDLKVRDPFGRFRIVMTSGDKYLIERGENLVEMKSQLLYVIPRSDRVVFMRINQIAVVEQMNGRRPTRRRAS